MRFGMLFVQKKDINDIRFHLFCYIRWFDLKGYGVTHSSVTSLMWFSIFNLIYIFTFKAGNFVPFREFGVSNGMFLTSVDFGWRAHILVLISTKPYRFDVSFMTSAFLCVAFIPADRNNRIFLLLDLYHWENEQLSLVTLLSWKFVSVLIKILLNWTFAFQIVTKSNLILILVQLILGNE